MDGTASYSQLKSVDYGESSGEEDEIEVVGREVEELGLREKAEGAEK